MAVARGSSKRATTTVGQDTKGQKLQARGLALIGNFKGSQGQIVCINRNLYRFNNSFALKFVIEIPFFDL